MTYKIHCYHIEIVPIMITHRKFRVTDNDMNVVVVVFNSFWKVTVNVNTVGSV